MYCFNYSTRHLSPQISILKCESGEGTKMYVCLSDVYDEDKREMWMCSFLHSVSEATGEERKRLLSHGNKLLQLTSSILDASLHTSVCENVQESHAEEQKKMNEWQRKTKGKRKCYVRHTCSCVVTTASAFRIFFSIVSFSWTLSSRVLVGENGVSSLETFSFLYKIISLGWGKRRKIGCGSDLMILKWRCCDVHVYGCAATCRWLRPLHLTCDVTHNVSECWLQR